MDGQILKRVAIKARQPHWKEKLRESCLQRVKKERRQLLWKIRSAGKSSPQDVAGSALGQILTDEINRLKHAKGSEKPHAETDYDAMLWEYEPYDDSAGLDKEDYEEFMIAMERILHEEMQTEKMEKEAALLAEFEKSCAEEDHLLATLLEQLQTREDGLLCPICKAGYLEQARHIIYCNCGNLRLDVQNEKVNLDYLQGRLAEVLQQHHDLGCKRQPAFHMDEKFSVTALYMQCSSCEMFELVL